MAPPIAGILTDFGNRDPSVGMMKGVMVGINPTLRLIDITHELTPQHVQEAALVLSVAYRCFPPGTIFVVVVDPGVGGTRRALVAETTQYTFVAPDNGVLGPVLDDAIVRRVVHVSNDAYFRRPLSRTFHGRDVFGPVAAWLSCGVESGVMGATIDNYARLRLPRPSMRANDVLEGEIIYQDRFGNLVTNLAEAWVAEQWGCTPRQGMAAEIGHHVIQGLDPHYARRPPGALGMIFNSWGFLEIFVNRGHAGEMTGASDGSPVRVWYA